MLLSICGHANNASIRIASRYWHYIKAVSRNFRKNL